MEIIALINHLDKAICDPPDGEDSGGIGLISNPTVPDRTITWS